MSPERPKLQKYMRKLLNLSEKISKYLVAAVLIIVPLLPKFPLINVPGTYVAIRFEDLLMLLLGLILIPKFILDYKNIWKDKLFSALFIFFAATFLSLISGVFLTQTVEAKIGLLHWVRRLEYMLPLFVTYLLIPKEKLPETMRFYFKVLVLVISVAFLYGMGQRYLNFPIIITQNEEYSKGIALRWTPGSHINSTFAGHYDLSGLMVLVLPVLLGVLFSVKDRLSRFIIALSSLMGLWLLINSISRTAQVAYLLSVSITLIFLKKYKAWVGVVIFSVICMFLSSGLDARFTQAIKVLYEHVKTGKSFSYVLPGFNVKAENLALAVPPTATAAVATPKPVSDVSIAIRFNAEWPRAIRAFLKNPLLGTGYSSIGLATDNDFLRMAGETGIIGLLSFVLIFMRVGKTFVSFVKEREKFSAFDKGFLFGIIGGVAGIFMIAFLIDLFEASKFAILFWLLLGLSVRMVNYKLNEK